MTKTLFLLAKNDYLIAKKQYDAVSNKIEKIEDEEKYIEECQRLEIDKYFEKLIKSTKTFLEAANNWFKNVDPELFPQVEKVINTKNVAYQQKVITLLLKIT